VQEMKGILKASKQASKSQLHSYTCMLVFGIDGLCGGEQGQW